MVMARQSLFTVFFLIIAVSLLSSHHVVFVTAATNNNLNKSSSPFLPAFVKRWRKRMGNIVRMMSYDIAGNQKNAVPALNFLDGQQEPLRWFRLDDGVMGGQSETNHTTTTTTTTTSNNEDTTSVLDFCGTINTNGGGFCSIRASLLDGGLPANTKAIRIRYSGDGKTYKFLMSDGTRGFSTPSWQHDIVTTSADNKEEQVIEIQLDDLKASMGPRPAPNNLQLNVNTIKEIGIMLSLKLSDGSPNPVETFGTGIFPFSLKVHSIEPIVEG